MIEVYYLKEERLLPVSLACILGGGTPDADDYVYVRRLDEDDPEKVWEVMQGTEENLPKDDAGEEVRSMVIGDVIIKGKEGYQVLPFGFREFDPAAAGFTK